jgi:hypothetical protein
MNTKLKQSISKNTNKLFLSLSTLTVTLSGVLLAFVLPMSAKAATNNYTVTPWTYVGAAGDCGTGLPAGTQGGVVSKWDSTQGSPAPSLRLEKNVPTFDCSSAGATIHGVNGIHLTELNFDYKGYCGAGSPRFNVTASDGFHFIGGCANGTQSPLTDGWTHVVFDTTSATQAFPAMSSTATVNSIEIIADEQGATSIDNISINDQIVTGPVTPTSKDACKNNGWKNLQDNTGKMFKNQGECVSWTEHNVNGNGTPATNHN